MTKAELFSQYRNLIDKGTPPATILLDIHMPGGETENIINPSVAAKMDYINKTYDDNLVHINSHDIYITDALFIQPDNGSAMTFTQAFDEMRAGAKVKLPSWGGYWFWDADKQTIIIHTKDGRELDIREMENVGSTMDNICSDEWMIADEENCSQLGGVALMSFGDAIKLVRRGLRVARSGWNGKGMYVFLAQDVEFRTYADISEFYNAVRYEKCYVNEPTTMEIEMNPVTVADMLVLRTAQGTFQPGWLASQADMLADDWYILPDTNTDTAGKPTA